MLNNCVRKVRTNGRAQANTIVTIPPDFIKKMHLQPGEFLEWREEDGHFCVVKGGPRAEWQ